MLCQIILTPWESKRLIAKAVVQLPEVQNALKNGIVCVARGTTTSYIMDEICTNFDKEKYCMGCIVPDRLCLIQKENQLPEMSFVKGKVKEIPSAEIIKEMTARDVFIKGANAVDCNFEAAVLLGSDVGGTVGRAVGSIYAKGINFVIPVGLEKLIPYSVREVTTFTGLTRVDFSMGMPVGLFPVQGKVITEIQALERYGVQVMPIASGGVNGAEGSTILGIQGDTEKVERVLQKIHLIKGEPPLHILSGDCVECSHSTCPHAGRR